MARSRLVCSSRVVSILNTVLKTVTAASGTGHNIGTATSNVARSGLVCASRVVSILTTSRVVNILTTQC